MRRLKLVDSPSGPQPSTRLVVDPLLVRTVQRWREVQVQLALLRLARLAAPHTQP
jgi:hypothetical protein